MNRASSERLRTIHEWRQRAAIDGELQPGYFRKGRRARGCPGDCPHCRAKKSRPMRRERASDEALAEWLRADGHETG